MNTDFTAYWHIVRECLIMLCGKSSMEAGILVRSYRSRLLHSPEYVRSDMIFHLEPWQLAFRLAGNSDVGLSPAQQDWYQKTVEDCIAQAAIFGSEDEVRAFQAVAVA